MTKSSEFKRHSTRFLERNEVPAYVNNFTQFLMRPAHNLFFVFCTQTLDILLLSSVSTMLVLADFSFGTQVHISSASKRKDTIVPAELWPVLSDP